MKVRALLVALAAPFAPAAPALAAPDLAPPAAAFTVELAPDPERPPRLIDPRLFGHFLERPSWQGETGPEAALLPGTRTLRPDVVALMRRLRIPLLRFPGGTDVDWQDWTDLIDDAPGRPDSARPVWPGRRGEAVTQEFGYPEFFALAEELGAETLVVVNLLDALAGRKPLAEAARHAAGLVAYANAPLGAALPAGMPDWPALRARHGRAEPWGLRYVQLGNEPWLRDFRSTVLAHLGHEDPGRHATWVADALAAYAEAIHAVDPTVELIIDGRYWLGIEEHVLADPRLRAAVRHVTFHTYSPFGARGLWREEQRLDPAEAALRPLDWWWAYVTRDGDRPDPRGRASFTEHAAERARATALGYAIAVTEWNYNTWWEVPRDQRPAFSLRAAAGPGLATLLHGLLREETIGLANQSLLVGRSWEITGIRVYPDEPGRPAHLLPQAAVMALYNTHRGERFLDLLVEGNPRHTLAYAAQKWESARPREAHALEAIATFTPGERLVLHLVNRHPERPARVVLSPALLALLPGAAQARLHTLAYEIADWSPADPAEADAATALAAGAVELPARSVNVLVLTR
jgi:hypothetical protein